MYIHTIVVPMICLYSLVTIVSIMALAFIYTIVYPTLGIQPSLLNKQCRTSKEQDATHSLRMRLNGRHPLLDWCAFGSGHTHLILQQVFKPNLMYSWTQDVHSIWKSLWDSARATTRKGCGKRCCAMLRGRARKQQISKPPCHTTELAQYVKRGLCS